jgi:hypothetical protein
MSEGVDFSFDPPGPNCLYAAGKRFVIMYTSIGPSAKNITRAKADAYLAAGLQVAVVAEESAGHMLGGAPAGRALAQASLEMARAAGAPPGIGHYFALDVDPNQLTPAQRQVAEAHAIGDLLVAADQRFDAVVRWPHGGSSPVSLTSGQWAALDAALDAAAAVLRPAGDRTGIYGGFTAVEREVGAHCELGYQTYAWSGGRWSAKAKLQQYRNGLSLCGGTVDLDRSLADDFGQWPRPEEFTMADAQTVLDELKRLRQDLTVQGTTGLERTVEDFATRQRGTVAALARVEATMQRHGLILEGIRQGVDLLGSPAQLAEMIAAELKELGVTVSIDATPITNAVLEALRTHPLAPTG